MVELDNDAVGVPLIGKMRLAVKTRVSLMRGSIVLASLLDSLGSYCAAARRKSNTQKPVL